MLNFLMIALPIAAFIMYRFSVTASKPGEIISRETAQAMTKEQLVAHNALRTMASMKEQFGDYRAMIIAHKLFIERGMAFPPCVNHDDFMKSTRYLLRKIRNYGRRELALF